MTVPSSNGISSKTDRDLNEISFSKFQVNIKESSPQGTLSMKMFGNELRLFTMEDFPLLVGDLNDIVPVVGLDLPFEQVGLGKTMAEKSACTSIRRR